MKQYLDLLHHIVDCGVEKESGRANMPNTIGVSHSTIKMDLSDGFPLLTTKKMYWKGIIHELLWFLSGNTNIKYLVDNNVNIWNGDAYRWYLKWWNEIGNTIDGIGKLETIDDFISQVKQDNNPAYEPEFEWHYDRTDNWGVYTVGDLGKVYGYQWRNQNGVDQVKEVLDGLKNNPYSRYHIIDGWNKADFSEMALPPCHLLYQFIVRPLSFEERETLLYKLIGHRLPFEYTKDEIVRDLDNANIPKFYLDLNMYQRSVDTLLGCPFNLASMSLLLMLFAKASNMISGVATWVGGDTHLYLNHIPMVSEQVNRVPYKLPNLLIKKDIDSLADILELTINDFELKNYISHPAIKAELFTGLKK